MLKPKTISRIGQVVAARLAELDTSLKQDIARIGSDLISRGLYNSSILISDTKAAAELVSVFNRLYEDQLRNITGRFNSAIRAQNRMLGPVPEPKPNIDRHTQSLLLFAEKSRGKAWRDLRDSIRSFGFGLLRRLIGF